jgi:hypothetical protein
MGTRIWDWSLLMKQVVQRLPVSRRRRSFRAKPMVTIGDRPTPFAQHALLRTVRASAVHALSRIRTLASLLEGHFRAFEILGGVLASASTSDAMVAGALIDRLVHRATMITLTGESYRLRERGTGIAPAAEGSVAMTEPERGGL